MYFPVGSEEYKWCSLASTEVGLALDDRMITPPRPHPMISRPASTQTKQEVQECFTAMAQAQGFRNVAGRAYTGHDAYAAGVSVCCCSDVASGDESNEGAGDANGDEIKSGMEKTNRQWAAASGEREGDRDANGGGNDGDGGSGGAGGDTAGAFSSSSCEETLSSSLAGLCLFNHVALT